MIRVDTFRKVAIIAVGGKIGKSCLIHKLRPIKDHKVISVSRGCTSTCGRRLGERNRKEANQG